MTGDPSPTPTSDTWVFAYGSLIYKIDFPYLERVPARIFGWQRRFWQGSHDHRGTPEAPGRVVTLVPARNQVCKGMAYLVEPDAFVHLDYREKNGYERISSEITLCDTGRNVSGTVYVADRDNHAFLGPLPSHELAAHIGNSHGPSGSNREYLLQLADALRDLGEEDPHVMELESLLTEAAP